MSITKLPRAYKYLKETRAFQKIVDSLTRGFRSVMKRDPDETEKFQINREAFQKYKNERKVLDVKFGTTERDFGTEVINEQAQDLKSFGKEVIDELNAPIKPDLEEVVPIKKYLDDEVATAQINKLKQDFDFNDRAKVMQLFEDIDSGKAFGAFDDVQKKELRDMISKMYTEKPEFASGGIARVGMFSGGTIGKGAMWFIKILRQAYDELVAGKAFTNLDPMKKELLRFEILAQIKNIEKGVPIPQDMINAMRRDPRFKDIMKTRSTDPELYEVEEIMLGKSSGKSDVDRMKDIQQKIELEDFDPKDRLPNAKGGLAKILEV